MKRRKKLRAPFIATFAFVAGACGGHVDFVNPPAQQGDGCPAAEPPSDGSCSTPGLACRYGDCFGQPTSEATCTRGAWVVSTISCNPPTPVCPSTEPTPGTACDNAVGLCFYHQNECDAAHGYRSSEAFECVGLVWEAKGGRDCASPPVPACPTDPPSPGAPCHGPNLKCAYGDCLGHPTTEATCNSAYWEVASSTCNPPAVDAGGGG